jgi:hypothetical protein
MHPEHSAKRAHFVFTACPAASCSQQQHSCKQQPSQEQQQQQPMGLPAFATSQQHPQQSLSISQAAAELGCSDGL